MCQWHDVMASSSAPISPIQNLFSQNQHEIASTGKQIWLEDLKCYLSLCQVSGTDSLVYQKSLNVLEQNCNVYWSKV